jgi:hypothetical protein
MDATITTHSRLRSMRESNSHLARDRGQALHENAQRHRQLSIRSGP